MWFNADTMFRENGEMRALLRQVSRSFYLTLRLLPGSIRPQIGLAYLLARATDTIADTRLVPVRVRIGALREMRQAIQQATAGDRARAPDLGELAEAQAVATGEGSAAERELLETLNQTLEVLRRLDRADRELIQDVLLTITRGQELDLVRFGTAGPEQIVALESDNEMEEYTYCVAGCVGEFWTKMCLAHVFRREEVEELPLLADGIRFGKGLQLVNILRDLPRDLRQGRCYIPAPRLAEYGLVPQDLLDTRTIERFRPLYDLYLQEAAEQLAAGWDYTNSLPRDEPRIRLACAWPVLIGARTLSLLHTRNVLDSRQRIKVARSEIHSIILRSILAYPFPSAWFRLFEEPRPRRENPDRMLDRNRRNP